MTHTDTAPRGVRERKHFADRSAKDNGHMPYYSTSGNSRSVAVGGGGWGVLSAGMKEGRTVAGRGKGTGIAVNLA